jgi:uncharacterized protein (TIGR04255 family)
MPRFPYQVNVVRTIPPKSHEQASTQSLIVDIDAMTTGPHLELDSSPGHLRALKWLKDKTFFSLITPAAKEEFRK